MRPTENRLRNGTLVLATFLIASCAGACGGGDDAPARKAAPAKVVVEAPEPTADADPDAPEDTTPGSLRGFVAFDGEPPERKPLAFGSVKGCNVQSETPPLSETVLVKDGRVQNCIVSIAKGLPRNYEAPPVPETRLDFTQRGCVYSPHVSAARAGQTLVFHNEDPTAHNVRIASRHQAFNQTQPAGGQDIEYLLEGAEPPVRIACDIHPWMRSWVGVFSHPFFAVTGPDGSFSIEGIPPGSYELVCWHEKLGKQKAKLTLPAGGSATVEFAYSE